MFFQGDTAATMHELNITSCLATSISGGSGGGIYMLATSFLSVTDGFLAHNNATRGGALNLLESSAVTLSHTTLRENFAVIGGAISLSYHAEALLKQRSDLHANQALREGGAIFADNHATITLERTLLRENQVTEAGLGGAISVRDDVILRASDTLFQVSDSLLSSPLGD